MKKAVLLLLSSLVAFAYQNIDAKTFATLLKEKDTVLIDVRTPQEFRAGHIPNANLIPLQLFGYLYLGGRGFKGKKVLVYCRSGNRSRDASRWLESWGVREVYNLNGGILEWQREGLNLVRR